jgi:hypothetical protein
MGGKSGKATIGYWYDLDILLTLCEKIEELVEIRVGERSAWIGSQTESGTISIYQSKLFGGEKREGGVYGQVDVMMGEADLPVNEWLGTSMRASGIDGKLPAYRGLASLFFRGVMSRHGDFASSGVFDQIASTPTESNQPKSFRWSAMNPYFKPVAVKARRFGDWYTAKAKVQRSGYRVFDETTEFEYQTIDNETDPVGDPTTFDVPATGWNSTGDSPFGNMLYTGELGDLPINTQWDHQQALWLRKTFTIDREINKGLVLVVKVENACYVYWDDTPVTSEYVYVGGANTTNAQVTSLPTVEIPIPLYLCSPGEHQIAIYCLDESENIGGADGDATYFACELKEAYSYDMNPAHIIYECLTNTAWGMGYPGSDIDDAMFTDVADALHDEDFGISLRWAQQSTIEDFIKLILEHINGCVRQDRTTGKLGLKLIRNDYDIEDLIELDQSNCVVTSYGRPSLGEIINEVTVKYTNDNGDTDAVTVQDLAGINNQGQVISQEVDLPGIRSSGLAARVAQRELEFRAKPIAKLTIMCDRTGFQIYEGDVFKLSYPSLGIDSMICRALEVDLGELLNNQIKIEAVEDVFGMPASSYVKPQVNGWINTSVNVTASPYRYLTETPYYDIARTLSAADLAYLDATDCYLDVYAAEPTPTAIDYELWTASGSNDVESRGNAAHAVRTTTTASVAKGETTVLAVADAASIVEVLADSSGYALLDAEYVRIDSYDTTANTITVSRGVLDTVPVAHASGTGLFIENGSVGQDGISYAPSEVVKVRVQTRTPSGELAIENTPEDSYTMLQRQARPYPPGKLRVNGSAYPSTIGLTDGLSLTWAHRNRLTQTAEIIPQSTDSITPEVGNTYNLRIYGQTDTLIRNVTGLTGTAYDYTTLLELSDLGGSEEPYWANVALLLNCNGANASTTFTDTSGTPKTVTASGNAQISVAQSKFGGASALFDGTGDYLSVTYTSALDIGSGDFTIEFWMRPGSVATGQAIIDWRDANQNKGLLITQPTAAPTKIRLAVGDSNNTAFEVDITSVAALSTGTWYHIAAVKLGETYSLYINGVLDSSATNAVVAYINSSNMRIGAAVDGTAGYNGYLDDIRLTKAARYKQTFTVPAAEYTSSDPSWASVTSLLNFNGSNGSTTFTDSSTSGLTYTSNGSAALSTAIKKFGTASLSLNGTTQYVESAENNAFKVGSGDFTMEAWVYPTSTPAAFFPIASQGSGVVDGSYFFAITSSLQLHFSFNAAGTAVVGGTVAVNTWSHVAVSMTLGVISLFVNGVEVARLATATFGTATGAFRIGRGRTTSTNYFAGYIDDFRITKGVSRYSPSFTAPLFENSRWSAIEDPHWSSVKLLLKCNGADASTTFTDSSPTPKTMTASGNAQIDTAQSKFGGASGLFDGTGDYLSTPDSADWDFSNGNFTIEAWVRLSVLPGADGLSDTIVSQRTSTTSQYAFAFQIDNNGLTFRYTTGGTSAIALSVSMGSSFALSTWYHVAVSRNGSSVNFFVDGTLIGTASIGTDTIFASTALLYVGSGGTTTPNYFTGWIDDLRITKGVARYTGSFLAPTYELGQYVYIQPALNTSLRFELEAQRDGLVSWQKHNHTVTRS